MNFILHAAAAGLLAATALSVSAQELVHASELPRRTLAELASHPVEEVSRRDIRHERKQALLPQLLPSSTPDPIARPHGAMPAPPVTKRFGSVSSLHLAPGDSSGAVGPQDVVGISNGGIRIHRRDGSDVRFAGLRTFWQAAFGDMEDYYDPRVAYDAASDRWIAVSIRGARELLVGVTTSGNPDGEWRRHRLTLSDLKASWEIDFTHLAVTQNTVLIVTYDDAGAIVLSVAKSDLYGSASPLPLTRYQSFSGVAPVTADVAEEYLVMAGQDGTIAFSTLARISRTWSRVSAASMPWRSAGIYAPQAGTANTLDVGWLTVENAVYRGGAIHVVRTIALSAPTRSAVLWTKFDPATATRLDAALIDDPSGVKFRAYPSVAVARSGAALIAYSTFSREQHVSAQFVFIDRTGRISDEGLIKAGEDAIENTDRWGDYTATVVDPLDDDAFWSAQLYAKKDRWATYWAKVQTTPTKRRATRH